ncbi:DDX47 helicase, partial [Polyodon spathula]|nr:DDX47 helicase [Polyodon spathula]
MLLVERVSEAQRFARIELREEGEKRKRPRHEGKEEGDSEQSRGVRDKIQGQRRGGKRGRVH